MAQRGSNQKVANSLVAVSTAAVLAVYAAGYARTRSAADRIDAQSAERRPAAPAGRGSAPAVPVGPPATTAPVYDWARDEGNTPPPMKTMEHAARVEQTPPATGVPAVATALPALPHAPAAPAAESKPEVAIANAPAITPPAIVPAPAVGTPPAPVAAPAAQEETPAAPKWKDGTYTGWGTCRHGDIQAEVVIAGGRITSATIAQCLTRYSCNVIVMLPPEVLQRQSAEVDYVSGATQSATAFYYAVVEALGKAK
jgi:uncharacterized protein with FMN-binding domain